MRKHWPLFSQSEPSACLGAPSHSPRRVRTGRPARHTGHYVRLTKRDYDPWQLGVSGRLAIQPYRDLWHGLCR